MVAWAGVGWGMGGRNRKDGDCSPHATVTDSIEPSVIALSVTQIQPPTSAALPPSPGSARLLAIIMCGLSCTLLVNQQALWLSPSSDSKATCLVLYLNID